MLVKIRKYIGFGIHRRSYLIWSPVIDDLSDLSVDDLNRDFTTCVTAVHNKCTWYTLYVRRAPFTGPKARAPGERKNAYHTPRRPTHHTFTYFEYTVGQIR